mmetsp:Transcript_36368/g.67735  ORF Transcript_36368/g.67735 Transcript_36368/m.67735 type:complete len:476 (+) Transcript_36368:94-1521(+)
MFNRPKVLSPNGTSPKRSPFTDIQNLSPIPGEDKESKGLDNFDWNRKLNLKKTAKARPKKKFVIEVAEEKNNSENYSPNSKTAYSAFGRSAVRNRSLTSKKSDSKDTEQLTDEDISISYDESSPRYESKDIQHENLLRIAHQLSPSSQTLSSSHTTPNSVKGPPTDMVSPVYTPTFKARNGNTQLLVGSPLLNVSKREIEVSPQTPDLSVSPSDQKTPPMDDSSDSKSCATSKEDKDDSYGEEHGYTEDAYGHNQYDANYDFNEEAYNEGYTDEQYQYHEDYEYCHNENANEFQITNQEYYSDMHQEVAEEKCSNDDVYTTTSHTSLKALTPVKLRASVTVVTEENPPTPQIEIKSNVDSPQSTSSSLTNFSTDIEVEQLFSKVRHNRIGDVKAILDRGVNPRTKDSNGNSLLHICAQNNLKKMASLVLEFGADINAENKKGITALDYCDNYHFDKLGDWFVQNGGDNGHANLRI